MMNVLVFKTSVCTPESIKQLRPILNQAVGKGKWNFALDDSDKILRITSGKLSVQQTVQLLGQNGFECIELED